ncbi:hypothetical protein EW145_g6313 [Phellinidium pouzarii]|uniref:Uncharacterized protein n=1 Tax=Phellinidium pouzarii TaxID=167371 RepID=A0A4S4KXJ4_9AGAM|nr:hypothetical protein EW145_g6313 [Phellinidium pouzarii]
MVGVVGFSMATLGFFLSIVAPVVAKFIPQFQAQMPALADARVQGHKQVMLRKSSRTLADPGPGLSGSLDSVSTSASNAASSTVLTAPTSVSEEPSQDLSVIVPRPVASQESRVCASLMRHICSSQRCANHASTSASASSSLEHLNERAKCKSRDSTSARSALRSSPTPSFLSLTPITSVEPEESPPQTSSASFESHAPGLPAREGGRSACRSGTFFSLRRTPKRSLTPSRSGSEPAVSRRNSLTPSPSRFLTSQGRTATDPVSTKSESATDQRDKLKKIFHFSRLKAKGKSKGKEEERTKSKKEQSKQKEDLSEVEYLRRHSEAGGERSSRKSLCGRSRSACRSDTAPAAQRTRPYEAPYNFPAPNSPAAVDYARRTRDEYMRLTASPSGSIGAALSDTSAPPLEHLPLSTPAHHVELVAPASRHRKSASASASAGADELGFILAAQSQSQSQPQLQNARSHVHYDVDVGVVRAATLPIGMRAVAEPSVPLAPRPILKQTGQSL